LAGGFVRLMKNDSMYDQYDGRNNANKHQRASQPSNAPSPFNKLPFILYVFGVGGCWGLGCILMVRCFDRWGQTDIIGWRLIASGAGSIGLAAGGGFFFVSGDYRAALSASFNSP